MERDGDSRKRQCRRERWELSARLTGQIAASERGRNREVARRGKGNIIGEEFFRFTLSSVIHHYLFRFTENGEKLLPDEIIAAAAVHC